MIDLKILTSRMLEAESLTDNLEDDDAKYLLDWGVSQIPIIIGETTDIEYANQRVSFLMRAMRTLNRIAGNWPDLEPGQLVELLENYTGAFSAELPAAGVDYQSAVAAVSNMDIRQAVEYLINWCESQK
jgi:hypothetical protein